MGSNVLLAWLMPSCKQTLLHISNTTALIFFFLHCQTKTQNVRTRVVRSGVTVKPGFKKLEVHVKVSIEIKNKVVGNFLQ